MQILADLSCHFVEHPEAVDQADPETTFIEAWKPLPAEADERTKLDIVFDEVQAAIRHLGDTIETGVSPPTKRRTGSTTFTSKDE